MTKDLAMPLNGSITYTMHVTKTSFAVHRKPVYCMDFFCLWLLLHVPCLSLNITKIISANHSVWNFHLPYLVSVKFFANHFLSFKCSDCGKSIERCRYVRKHRTPSCKNSILLLDCFSPKTHNTYRKFIFDFDLEFVCHLILTKKTMKY